jgi:hypothetical protein
VSMDIEGGEIDALKGFPFDKYQIGTLSVEHNYQEPSAVKSKHNGKPWLQTRAHFGAR